MKKIMLLTALLIIACRIVAQNQEINGALTTAGDIHIGKDITNKWGEGSKLYLEGINNGTDHVWLAKYTSKQDFTDLRINIGDVADNSDRLIIGTTHWNTKEFNEAFVVRADGSVGIGIAQPTSKLDVNGTIRAKEVKIEATGWADFVFAEDYKLPTLSEVENHIIENKHLPDIPSEIEVKENGISIGEMQAKLLQKIEELTLYIIEQDKKNSELEKRVKELEDK
ncbi:hypothetical protein [Dysgonomonas sp. ZJ709]|uniref:hypothetical protein n=1 Tax=Dysgonomonas sp. ZJ709 TaxID=2709797 RepID=UPI0013EE39A6|nr:hypothetical protein [Dysgonomonas sp. ZJ709]